MIRVDAIRLYVPIFFNVKTLFTPVIFKQFAASSVFTYRCIIPQQRGSVGDIQRPPEGEVKDILTGNMWAVVSGGSW